MNKRNTKLEYVGVLSSKPGMPAYRSTFKYFNKYLITLGEPTAAPSWTLMSILKHAKNIIINEKMPKAELMIDSGGFQIIVNKITRNRILEYVECYHQVLELYPDEIQKIFSLDINNMKMTPKEILEWNYKSTQMTIDSMQKFPQLKEKVLFVIQNRNRRVFEIWRKLFVEKRAWEHFDLYSIGGLVGLKKDTNVDFNHAVPGTMWLLTYAKKYNFEIKQLHWLGQSSKVVFIAMALIEKVYGIYLTSDSSELIRFAPIAQKLPLIRKIVAYDDKTNEFKDDFNYARTGDDVMDMLLLHSWDDDHCKRATRDNLRELDIDIDVLTIVNQDTLDILLHSNLTWSIQKDILTDMRDQLELVNFICKSLIRVFQGTSLIIEDTHILKFPLNEEELKGWNLIDSTNLSLEATEVFPDNVKLQNFYNYIKKIKGFKYLNQRSTVSREIFEASKKTKLDNCDYIELQCQHVENAILVSDVISDKILEIGLKEVTMEDLSKMHPILNQGRTAKTVYENIGWMLRFEEIIKNGNIEEADEIMRNIVDSYEK